MDVQCERCKTEYEFDDALVSGRGTTVRCTNCGHQFKVRRPDAPEAGSDQWVVQTASGQRLTFLTLRELQRAILAKQVGRGDVLTRGAGAAALARLHRRARAVLRRSNVEPAAARRAGVDAVPRMPPAPAVPDVGDAPAFPKRTASWGARARGRGPPASAPPRRSTHSAAGRDAAAAASAAGAASAACAPHPLRVPSSSAHAVCLRPGQPTAPPGTRGARRPSVAPPPDAASATGGLRGVLAAAPAHRPRPARRVDADDDATTGDAFVAAVVDRRALRAAAPTARRRVGRRLRPAPRGGRGRMGRGQAVPRRATARRPPRSSIRARRASWHEGEKAMTDGNLELAQEAFDKASALAEHDPRVLLDEARVASPRRRTCPGSSCASCSPDATDEQRATKAQLADRVPRVRKAADDAVAARPDDPAAMRAKIDALRLVGRARRGAQLRLARSSAQASQPETAYVLAALDLAEPEPLWTTVIDRLRLAAAGEGNAGRARAALVYALAKSGDVRPREVGARRSSTR